jgi:ABC-type transporter Mla maintaining outer membrane lipid asymmetry ATPase subunit MlaF
MNASTAAIEVRGVVVGYGETVVQQNLNFQVHRGEVFVVSEDRDRARARC